MFQMQSALAAMLPDSNEERVLVPLSTDAFDAQADLATRVAASGRKQMPDCNKYARQSDELNFSTPRP
jgi:hypothetical protein